jgi:hypothetical protein
LRTADGSLVGDKVSLSDHGNPQSVDLDFGSLPPRILKLNALNDSSNDWQD